MLHAHVNTVLVHQGWLFELIAVESTCHWKTYLVQSSSRTHFTILTNLKRGGKASFNKCKACGNHDTSCSCKCTNAIEQGRYTCRHGNIIFFIAEKMKLSFTNSPVHLLYKVDYIKSGADIVKSPF